MTILKVSYIMLILCTTILNATSFSKKDAQEFLDHPHLGQIIKDFLAAGFDKITDKEKRELKALQIMFKNKDYIDASMETGIGSTPIKYMKSGNPDLQFEAIRSLKKAASRDAKYAEEIVDEGAIPELIKHLHSSNPMIVLEALKAISAIVFQNYELRDQFLERGLAEHLVELADPKTPEEILLEVVHAIMVLTMNEEYPISKTTVKTILPSFGDLIRHRNPKIARDMTWALVSLTDEGNEKYNIYVNKDVVEDLFELIKHKNPVLHGGAVGVIRNIIDGKNDQTKMALDNGLLKLLPELLMHEEDPENEAFKSIVTDTLLILTKLFAASGEHTKMIFDSGITPLIIYHLARGLPEEQQEAAWALSAGTSFGNETHITKMVDLNVITPMCKVLIEVQNTSADLVEVILKGFSEILAKIKANRIEEIYQDLENCSGIEITAHLGEHGVDVTKYLAYKIMKYFCTAETEAVCKSAAF